MNHPHDRLFSSLANLLPEAVEWLRRLVEINSFTSRPAGVKDVTHLTAEMFAPLGFQPEWIASENSEYGPHLFLRRQGQSETPPVVLVTHSDTVFPPEEEERENFRWKEMEGRIYGPGTVDNKGGTVLIWLMLQAMKEWNAELLESTNWLIAANASEEVTASDFGRLTRERCQKGAGAVLVFEGGPRQGDTFQIVTARKGRAEFVIDSIGKAAHAGSSHGEGINAIVGIAKCLAPISALSNSSQELTVNIAKISGGTVLNRVPHEAQAALEMRAFEPSVLAATESRIKQILEEHSHQTGSLQLRCEGRTQGWPGDGETMRLFDHWAEAARVLGYEAVSIRRGGLSDANYLAGLGPMLDGMGPAGANAHCSEWRPEEGKLPEFVEVDSFVPKAALNLVALTRVLQGVG